MFGGSPCPMSKFYRRLTPSLRDFIAQQKVFFTASSAPTGRINLSPKGLDSLRCLGDDRVAYLDLTGSGNETAAHLRADGRLTLMFCSFEADPLILRLYGQGKVVQHTDDDWATLYREFTPIAGARQIIVLAIESVQTSCGYAVPRLAYQGDRPKLEQWARRKGEDGLRDYRRTKNLTSIDGLPTGLVP